METSEVEDLSDTLERYGSKMMELSRHLRLLADNEFPIEGRDVSKLKAEASVAIGLARVYSRVSKSSGESLASFDDELRVAYEGRTLSKRPLSKRRKVEREASAPEDDNESEGFDFWGCSGIDDGGGKKKDSNEKDEKADESKSRIVEPLDYKPDVLLVEKMVDESNARLNIVRGERWYRVALDEGSRERREEEEKGERERRAIIASCSPVTDRKDRERKAEEAEAKAQEERKRGELKEWEEFRSAEFACAGGDTDPFKAKRADGGTIKKYSLKGLAEVCIPPPHIPPSVPARLLDVRGLIVEHPCPLTAAKRVTAAREHWPSTVTECV